MCRRGWGWLRSEQNARFFPVPTLRVRMASARGGPAIAQLRGRLSINWRMLRAGLSWLELRACGKARAHTAQSPPVEPPLRHNPRRRCL